jgi:hypothetical protein
MRGRPRWQLALAGVAVFTVLALLLWAAFGRKDTDRQLAAMAQEYEDAIGVVVIAGQVNGRPYSGPIATAWAVGEKVFVSNGHVAEPVAKALAKGASAHIVLNRNPDKTFRIVSAVAHPRYGQKLLNVEGKEPAVPAYDVGVLRVDTPVPRRFRIASRSELARLDSGYRVAYLGFPTEGMTGGGVDVHRPVANMQSGIITSVTDYWLSKAPVEKALLLSHNLAAAGGASGSPVFNASGQVVGVLSAGNIAVQLDLETGKPTRTPSAVLINFAQRIDILRDIYPDYPQ